MPTADAASLPETAPPRRVSVKTLCAFSAKAGDIDLRFVPAPTAKQGMAGHLRVQSRRGPDYQSEVTLSATHGGLQVRGRADGYDAQLKRVEEIKTFRGRFDAIRDNHRALHWAQAKVYGWMLCVRDNLAQIDVALVYLDLGSDEETLLQERWTRDALQSHFEALCDGYAAWADAEAGHHDALVASLSALAFPYPAFRSGQRDIADAVYRCAAAGRDLLVEAPTGIGKTLATLFPLLKARARRKIEKVYFLTAKTSGRPVALAALRHLVPADGPLRVIELVAREKVCEHPGKACNGDACPLARGFYDRLPAARAEAVGVAWLDRPAVRRVAMAHAVCPYFLSQELVRWSDVVIGDYNHYFDSSAFLYALMRDEDWQVALLIDEAHNLLSRARAMYTAQLDAEVLARVCQSAPASLQHALRPVERAWQSLRDPAEDDTPDTTYRLHSTIDEKLAQSLQGAVSTLAEHFAEHPDEAYGERQQFFFNALQFTRLADSFGDHSVFESTRSADGQPRALAIRNLLPAPFLQARFAGARSCTCFSGTLAPFDFHRQTLGLPEATATLRVGSPFRSAQLDVRLPLDLSTRYRDRHRTLDRLTDLIAQQFSERPGNYLAFFSSFEYLDSACSRLAVRHPGLPVWCQSRGMPDADRHAFIDRFRLGGQGIGFAVLGGAFGEGIDLPGDRLIGAFVASLGLPQHNALNEAMRERMEAQFGDGWAYTYLYPGLQKVVQAAGRVIRTEQDAGVLYLLDDRFRQPDVQALLPDWWNLTQTSSDSRGCASDRPGRA